MTQHLLTRGDLSTTLIDADGDDIRTWTDRAIADVQFFADVTIAEHLEFDCGDGDGCGTCRGARDARTEAKREEERRIEEGIQIEDPHAETLEERLAPWGTEWQIERRERAEGW